MARKKIEILIQWMEGSCRARPIELMLALSSLSSSSLLSRRQPVEVETERGPATRDYLLSMNSCHLLHYYRWPLRPTLVCQSSVLRPAEDLTHKSTSCGHDVFFCKFPYNRRRRLALLPQLYYPLSRIKHSNGEACLQVPGRRY